MEVVLTDTLPFPARSITRTTKEMKVSTFMPGIMASLLPMDALSFAPQFSVSKSVTTKIQLLGMVGGGGLPYGPSSGSGNQDDTNDDPADNGSAAENQGNVKGGTLRGNRFSKYAPDASLETSEFRDQLKENMKADLERRRREDPNRGNQPAKTYLDNL